MGRTRKEEGEPTIIKKYANRRLYDTGRSSYVTLDDLCEMVKEGHDFVVLDAKTEEDITRSVLTQIIVDQESKSESEGGQNLLPTSFLRKLIGFYGDNVQALVPNYLDTTLDLFVKNQERMREQINKSFEGMGGMGAMSAMNPMQQMQQMQQNMQNMQQNMQKNMPGMESMFKSVPALDELNKQNMAMFERAMKVMSPFTMAGMAEAQQSAAPSSPAATEDAPQSSGEPDDKLDALKRDIANIKDDE